MAFGAEGIGAAAGRIKGRVGIEIDQVSARSTGRPCSRGDLANNVLALKNVGGIA